MSISPALVPLTDTDPWVADLHGSSDASDCQSTVGFEDHPCLDAAHWYAVIDVREYTVGNPRWEGKVCDACLAGWREWAAEEPAAIAVVSVHPIAAG